MNVKRTVCIQCVASSSVGCMSPHLCVIVFWVRAAVSLCCPIWSLGPAGNLECAHQLGRDIQLIHFLVSENGNAQLDNLNRVKVPRVRGVMFGEGEDIIRNIHHCHVHWPNTWRLSSQNCKSYRKSNNAQLSHASVQSKDSSYKDNSIRGYK